MGSKSTRHGDPRITMPVMTAVHASFTPARTRTDDNQLAEHAYISACIDNGVWSPESDGLGQSFFPASVPVFRWLNHYAEAEDGKAPPLRLLQERYPQVSYIHGCGRRWARDVLLGERRKSRFVEGLREALSLIADDETDQAYDSVRRTLSGVAGTQQEGISLGDVSEEDAGAKLPPLYRAIESCGGITEGDYVLILARTNVGKSFRLMQHAVECAREGRSVAYFSLEMRAGRCANRLHPMILGKKSLQMTWEERSLATKQWLAERGASFRLIDDSSGPVSTESVVRMANPGDIVFIDYIGLMKDVAGARMGQDWHVASGITNSIRSLTSSEGLTVFAGAQANRATGNNAMPDDMSVGLTDAIPQDIDLGIALQRKRRDLPFTINSVFKARNGSITESKWFTMFNPTEGDYSEITAEEAWEMSESLEQEEIL